VENNTVGYPDFIGVKATESLNNDTIIAIVEVKRDRRKLAQSVIQLVRYLKLALSKQRDPTLRGFLIAGETIHVYRLLTSDRHSGTEFVTSYPTHSHHFEVDLHAIAGQYWA
jgi:RecB family endonuclease NucS